MSSPSHLPSAAGQTRSQIIKQFASLSQLFPCVETFCDIVQLYDHIIVYKHTVRHLRDHCHLVLSSAKEKEENNPTDGSRTAIASINSILSDVKTSIHELNGLDAVVRQDEIGQSIQRCHTFLSKCLIHFQDKPYQWNGAFIKNLDLDYRDHVEYLSDTQNESNILQQAKGWNADLTRRVLELMQSALNNGPETTTHTHTGLSSNLYQLQLQSNEILFDMCNEISFTGPAVTGTPHVDIFKGVYLEREAVAVKVIRVTSSNEHSLRRFNREVKVWAEIWKVDAGRHLLPFYGFGRGDRPFPYFVSPWQQNGNALSYVQKKDCEVDYKQLIKGIALGIRVLQDMSPPIVHGNLNATNVLIGSQGQPLLADFGFSQILQDISGAPLTQSGGFSNAFRWFAPEVWKSDGKLSTMSDIYSYGMTVLELFTHKKPYANIRHTPEVTLLASEGKFPERPTESRVIERGLDDNLWTLLTQCWGSRPEARPNIQTVIDELDMQRGHHVNMILTGSVMYQDPYQDRSSCEACAAAPHSMSASARPRRLVHAQSLKLVEFSSDDLVPPYAVLSHRWLDGEEVALPELSSPCEKTRSKSGYRKIEAACRLALKAGLDYIWIDTCCIDQDDPDDVSRNIRLMFTYYANAQICYAYLTDVHSRRFFESEWFDRGWTLQELLAPRGLVFFDKDWIRIGCKHELSIRTAVSSLTTIPSEVLSGQKTIDDVDSIDRMSWAMGRETSKPEDQAYCLLGLLDVSMEPNYGEGIQESFKRLRSAFMDNHPGQRDSGLGAVQDFYSFLQTLHRRAMRRRMTDLLSRH